jgi:hypothetical protein
MPPLSQACAHDRDADQDRGGDQMGKRVLVLLSASLALAFQAAQTAPFNDSIRKEEFRPEVFFLAGDFLQGRSTNTPGALIAAEYIKTRYESIGLKPAGDSGTYFQSFNMMTATLGEPNSLEIVQPGAATLRLKPTQDYYPLDSSASGTARAEVVYVGFGITMADLGYDDYRGKNVAGKIALALTGEPGENDPKSPFDGVVRSEGSNVLRKALWAQEHGAIGIMFVQNVNNQPGPGNFEATAQRYWPAQPPRVPRLTLSAWADKVRIPAIEVSPALGAVLIRGTKRSLEEMSKSAETAAGFDPLPVPGVEVAITANVQRHTITARNVLGAVEGSDPKLKDEYIIVSGHLDHVSPDGTQVFPGADDNVTGTVATIKIAEAFMRAAKAGQRPRRSLLFAVWEAEERGLLGAWAYTEEPFWPLDKAVAILNMDLIGRNEEVPEGGGARFRGLAVQTSESNKNTINILGTARCPELKTASEKANKPFGLGLLFRYDNNVSNLMRRSDQWPFINHGVPGLWFLTGLHPDYHTVNDRPEKVDYAKMERVTRLVHQMSWDLAQDSNRPKLLPRK